MMSANLRAFLAMLRWCEGTSGDNGYRTIVGGDTFTDYSDHPRIRKSGTFSSGVAWSSDAAGAYQFLSRTWAEVKAALDLPDFSPESQDRAAVFLIKRRGALQAVEDGDLARAIELCNREWASLPGSPYGQPMKSLDACRAVFRAAGGVEQITQAAGTASPPLPPPAPVAQPKPAAPPAPITETAMPLPVPALIALGAELLKIIPWGQKRAERIEQAAPVLVEIAQKVSPQSVNEQAAVQRVLSDPQAKAEFVAATAVRWSDIAPALEYDARERREAREFGERLTGTGPMWRQVGAGVLLAVLALGIIGGIGWTFHDILFADGDRFSQSTRDSIVQVLINVGVLVVGYFFGSSAASRAKDSTIQEQARR